MTELEQIAYDNGVACGFMVARGIAMSPLPVEHEIFKYENWTDEMKAMLIEKPYYIMYSWGGSTSYNVTFSVHPFVFWAPNWKGEDTSFSDIIKYTRPQIRFTEGDRRTNTFSWNSSTKVYTKQTVLNTQLDTSTGIKYLGNSWSLIPAIFYTNGITSVIENIYKDIEKFPLKLNGAAKNYYEPQSCTAKIKHEYRNVSGVSVTEYDITCHGGDIYSYASLIINKDGIIIEKRACFTNTYLWELCTTLIRSTTTNGVMGKKYVEYLDYVATWMHIFDDWSYTCTIPIFKDKATLTNYLNTNICSASDFEYMPSNYYIDENGKLIKS